MLYFSETQTRKITFITDSERKMKTKVGTIKENRNS